ncbi:MAG: endopeptidase La [Lentisphaerae bacterium]|nr:endopeptidase La [Lentisphaerota bacterium]MCP4103562.1 endopeptidase La [Lentisphaerota bacterium]
MSENGNGNNGKVSSITVKSGNYNKNDVVRPDNCAPILTLDSSLVFPFTLTPLVIEGDENVRMIKKSTNENRLVCVFPIIPPPDEIPRDSLEVHFDSIDFNGENISQMGVLVRIVKMLNFPDGTVRVLVRGLKRITYKDWLVDKDSIKCIIYDEFKEEEDESLETSAMIKNAVNQFQEIISFSPNFPEELKIAILNVEDNSRVIDLMADTLNIGFIEKLSILTLPTMHERLQMLTILLNREVEVLHLGSEIQSQVHNALSRSQRDFFLREQLKTIKHELGEDNVNPDVEAIQAKLEKLKLPENVEKVIGKELERLEVIPQASAEYHVAFNYVDWLVSVPWTIFSEDRLDVKEASKVLNHDHYGLQDVKQRILEFLAVLQLKDDRKAPILCFVGPPGVGKTSLGQSIARAMERKFVRMSLGGVRDEAEIRGHRRTYVGALPGRIIQGLKKAGTANPVFMLDEIDKLGADYRGDPSSALLEVLDPEQNKAFNDHYLELDYDLSSVLFIATANILDTIPPALRDRMEIIRLPGYTGFEKKQIARNYLVPRQLRENGLKKEQVMFSMPAVDEIINYYTREAGVRTLERTIGKVCRKIATKIVTDEIAADERTKVNPAFVRESLGPRIFIMDEAEKHTDVGVATGMAWTSSGGTILPVEVTSMPGKGMLKLTGSLGNVMKESAEAAFSYIRSSSNHLKVNPKTFENNDFHIHVPDGATPKDGPSAGITMTVALASLLTNRKVKSGLSMTGEITLRGKVTAVGGIKEKVIAALRSGVKAIVMPAENEKDLEEIPEDVKNKLDFFFVKNADEAFKVVFEATVGRTRTSRKKK